MKTRKIKMQFADMKDSPKMLTVDYPKEEIETDEVKAAMDEIVASKVLSGKEGQIQKSIKAYEEIVDRNEYMINQE
ncbi:MAG: DUF2922 domain-containing protein [Peptoniphilaceae bacterium]|nr:DUF2922 domain-containing protein [Peptoniphilaceae bacterium]MDY6018490.1 DUF2922 domain-containing protein [Anaerococcus sp.]